MDETRAVCALKFNFLITFYGFPRWQYVLRQNIGGPQELAPLPTNTIRFIIIRGNRKQLPHLNVSCTAVIRSKECSPQQRGSHCVNYP